MKENNVGNASNIAMLGMLLCLALIMSYVERLIPFSIGIPGVKLGLANIVSVWLLYRAGAKEAITVGILRVILAGFMFGSMGSIIYSISGLIISIFVMILMKKADIFSIIGVSICGGIMHNLAQLVTAAIVLETYTVAYYMPVLLISGCITGACVGIAGGLLYKYVKM